MLNAETYMQQLITDLHASFGERLIYVGLQGSYLRGEATENSDIDPMVVIDQLTRQDLQTYRALIARLPAPEKSCGFLCGRDELTHWNPLELCHLIHATRDLYGQLLPLLPAFSEQDVRNFIRLSVGNLYHELCHRFVHGSPEKNCQRLPQSCKGVFFILQNLHYLQTGVFCETRQQLLSRLNGSDRDVMSLSLQLSAMAEYDFDAAFDTLLRWCQQTLASL